MVKLGLYPLTSSNEKTTFALKLGGSLNAWVVVITKPKKVAMNMAVNKAKCFMCINLFTPVFIDIYYAEKDTLRLQKCQ